ncbi:MAG: MBL fold metallo-hydrolase RNA specificity domain-containing protein [Thermogutta sp.]
MRRPHAQAFVSHAHSDHIARHEYILCTAETGAFLRLRLGPRQTREMSYGQTIDWAGVSLTVYPAGHCLGSAMLAVEYRGERLLYTGDFKLRPALTTPAAQPIKADILIMETTYGDPRYRMPPEEEVLEDLIRAIRKIWDLGRWPVVIAYALGKAQEISARLCRAGLPIVQHSSVASISRIYEQFGVSLGSYRLFDGTLEPGEVLITSPQAVRNLANESVVRIAVTGWALHPSANYRLNADLAFPLSDHADYDELLQMVEAVQPTIVYCTHGPETFVRDLMERGWDARLLGRPTQKLLF